MGWLVSPNRDRWMVWMRSGAHALVSVESEAGQSSVHVDLLAPSLQSFVEVRLPRTSPDRDAALLEEIVETAVAGDLELIATHRNAWVIAIRSAAKELEREAG